MKIVRSIAAIVVGLIVMFVVIVAAEAINGVVYKPDNGQSFEEWMTAIQEDKEAMKAWIDSLPQTAMVVVLLGWLVGGFLGGGLAALIAGRARLVHAGIIGTLLLVLIIWNTYELKQCGITHPDWMLVGALVLPIPISLLAGKLVSMLFPPPPVTPS